ncbi:alpha,alpha-phosphotrehalase [Spiroplasma alleghenense]|uniref:Alpha-glucosidase n=1 Tax=Spiroplasma alleghenense TaxID=216931 RepID=A0A345Z514_9MOLU|nr:alpha,alpha-phosphotrehalase [Spiroplasma alleghenense]AXK51693.1 alpha-glucosidase [Spiroplasma alleghenense]
MFNDKIVYQVFPKTFYDAKNTGAGQLAGVTAKLDYLKELGIDYIWISPFFKSDFVDGGYDVIDYYQIDPSMGDEKELANLIKEADNKGMKIIMDMVLNHTSTKSAWFQAALKGDKYYQDFYFFKKPVNNQPPTNWLSKFGGSAWEYVEKLDMYYLHVFSKEQADLNWANPEVQKEILKVLNYWIAKGAGGFRFDVCNLYGKPEVFEDSINSDGREFYTDSEINEKYFEIINKLALKKASEPLLTVGELSSTSKEKAANYAQEDYSQLSMIFNFHHLKVDFKNNQKWNLCDVDFKKFKDLLIEWQLYFQERKSGHTLFLNNHDQPRAISRFGNDNKYWKESAKMLAALVQLMKGTVFIYQGEEIGMTNYPFESLDDFIDSESVGQIKALIKAGNSEDLTLKIMKQKSRDHSRTAMQWSGKTNAGFNQGQKLDKILLNPNYKTINVVSQKNDSDSILKFYQDLIKLRKNNLEIIDGVIRFLQTSDEIIAYERILESSKITVVANISVKEVNFKTDLKSEKIILNNYTDFNQKLKPYQVVVFKESY